MICTEIETANGKFTGKIKGEVCYGKNKVTKIKNFLKDNKINVKLSECEAYSDSISDVPMLSIVGKPFATNPDPALEKYAKEHKWRIIKLK